MGCGCGRKQPSAFKRNKTNNAKKSKASDGKKARSKNHNRIGKLSGLVKASKKPRKSRKSK